MIHNIKCDVERIYMYRCHTCESVVRDDEHVCGSCNPPKMLLYYLLTGDETRMEVIRYYNKTKNDIILGTKYYMIRATTDPILGYPYWIRLLDILSRIEYDDYMGNDMIGGYNE